MLAKLENLLVSYKQLFDYYMSELDKLPQIRLHYKNKNGRWKPYINTVSDGKQKQVALSKHNDPNHLLEEQLKYRHALIIAIRILSNNCAAIEAFLHGKTKRKGQGFVPFSYETVDAALPPGFLENGWTFAKYCSIPLSKETFVSDFLRKYDVNTVNEWKNCSLYPEYKAAVLRNDTQKLKYDTGMGFRVRSKSEVLISTALTSSLPFKYEEPLALIVYPETKQIYEKYCRGALAGDSIMMLPDFTILCPDGSTVIWEHQGLMDNDAYLKKFYFRQDIYTRNGFLPGRDIVFSYESEEAPLDMEQINSIVRYIIATKSK